MYKKLFNLTKSVSVLISSTSFFAIISYYLFGLMYDFLTPLQQYLVPVYSTIGGLFMLAFIFCNEKHMIRLQIFFKLYAAIMISLSLIEGAIVPNSNIELIFVWLPVFYIAAIFGAESNTIRKV